MLAIAANSCVDATRYYSLRTEHAVELFEVTSCFAHKQHEAT